MKRYSNSFRFSDELKAIHQVTHLTPCRQCNLPLLGVMYDNGQGVPQDYKAAVKWYSLAAEQGHAFAQYNLGVSYTNGEGVIQDNVYAHMWFNIAASSGDSENASGNRDIIAGKMTTAQISEAQKLARECVRKEYKGC